VLRVAVAYYIVLVVIVVEVKRIGSGVGRIQKELL
jgi:hypothetical protein